MRKVRSVKILALAATGLMLAAVVVGVIAVSRDDGGPLRAAAQEGEDQQAQAWLGVLVKGSEDPAGIAVRHVVPESPAAQAGLERGDVITALDGEAIGEGDGFWQTIEGKSPGDTVTLSVIKNGVQEPEGDTQEIQVTLGERPDIGDLEDDLGGQFPEHFGGEFKERLGEVFERFIGGEFRYLDEDGNEVTYEIVAGAVQSIAEDEVTLDVNGDEGERSFSIPDGVDVPEGIEQGDQAVVVLENGEVEYVLGGHFPSFGPGLIPGGFAPFEGE